MMRLIILAIVALLAIGCTTTKQLSQSNELTTIDSSTVDNQSDSTFITHENISRETLENVNISEDFQIEIKEYDTTQPVDSATGKPPLKREYKASSNKQTNADNRTQETSHKTDSARVEKSGTMTALGLLNKRDTQEVTKETKYVFPWLGIIGGGIVALLIIGIIKLWKSKFWKMR